MLSTPLPVSPPGSSAEARTPASPSMLTDDEDITVWHPAAPRLRLFSPAPPRPSSAASTSPRRTTLGVAAQPRPASPTPRPSSAICGKLSIPRDHERVVTPAVSSPGAAPSTHTPNRAANILSKVQAIQARASAAAHNPRLNFGAQTVAAASAAVVGAASPSVLHDSPPGSPLLVVRSVPRPPRLLTTTSTSPGSPLVANSRSRRSSMPEHVLHTNSSSAGGVGGVGGGDGGDLQLPPATPRGAPGTSQSDEADPPVGASSNANVSLLLGSPRGDGLSPVASGGARRRVGMRSSLLSSSGGDGAGTATTTFLTSDSQRVTGMGDSSGGGMDGGGDSSAAEDNGRSRGRGGDSGCESGGCESGGEGRSANRRRSALGAGGSSRFIVMPPAPQSAASPSGSPLPSPSPVIWPWPQDSSRRSSVAEGSPFAATAVNIGLFNHLNMPSHPSHLSHLSHSLDSRGSTLGGGPLSMPLSMPTSTSMSTSVRGGAGFSSPVRPASSAALLVSARSMCVRSRPWSCSGGGGAAAAVLARPNLSITGRSPAPSSGGGGAAGCGSGAVAAAAAAMTPSTRLEIIPDLHSLPAAAATAIPAGGRVARAIAGILPSGNPGTFNLKVEERVKQVLHEGVTKAPAPKAAAVLPNPAVIKMLHDRHEAEAQRSLVDSAFSSGNPAAWMHQMMAESGAAAPPWAAAAAPAQQRQQQQQQQADVLTAHHHGRLGHAQSGKLSRQPSRQQTIKSQRSRSQQQQQRQQQQFSQHPSIARSGRSATQIAAAAAGASSAAAAASASPQRLGTGLGPGVPRHTSAEMLHLQSMSYLASKEACRTLAADSRPAVSINLREVLQPQLLEGEGAGGGGGGGGGMSARRPRSGGGGGKVRFQT